MMMEPFHSKFPEVAAKETRCAIIPEGNALPVGEYSFVESYCNDKTCDCRRVFLNVFYGEQPLVTIVYGWEDIRFYKKWIGDRSLAKEMKGPSLELGGYSSIHENEILRLFKNVMLADQTFIERLKKHYSMFKKKL